MTTLTDAAPADSMHLRVQIDAQPDAIYRALTDADVLIDWFAESAEVDLDQSRFEFWGRYAPHGDQPRQRLLSAEPGKQLRFSWDLPVADTGAGGSTVTVNLDAHDGGTLVTVDHRGTASLDSTTATALRCFWHVSLANLEAHCEGLPTTPPFDFSVPARDDAIVRTVIDAGVEEVFASLLDAEQVNRWAGGKATIEPSLGGRYDFGWDHGPVSIVEFDPNRTLAYSWRYPGSPDTLVRWTLRGSRGSTFLTLIHSGFDNDVLAEQFRQGWPGFLVEIKRMLELGGRWQPIWMPSM